MGISHQKPGFAFFEVANILGEMFYIHASKSDTFKSRLQQLQKAGLPAGANFGRGAKIRYMNWQVADLALMLELLDLGIPPGLLSDFYGSVGGKMGRGIYAEGANGWNIQQSLRTGEANLYALMIFDALVYLRLRPDVEVPPSSSRGMVFPSLVASSELADAIDRLEKSVVVNMSDHLHRLRAAVETVYPDRLKDITFTPAHPNPEGE